MSLLLDLLKTAHTVYKNMEDTRKLPYVDSFIPSLVPRGSSKAHILEEPLNIFLRRMQAEPAISHDEELAFEILKLKYPEGEKAISSASSSDKKEDVKIKDENSERRKLAIILDIIKACANLELNYKDEDLVLAKKILAEARPHFETAFAGVKEAEYFLFKAYDFVKLIPDLKKIAFLNQRFVDTEIECGRKTQKIEQLEAEHQALQKEHTQLKVASSSLAAKNKELIEQQKNIEFERLQQIQKIEQLEAAITLRETEFHSLQDKHSQHLLTAADLIATNNELTQQQTSDHSEIIELKEKLFGPKSNLTSIELQTLLNSLEKKHAELNIINSQNYTDATQAKDTISKLKTEIEQLRKPNTTKEKPPQSKTAVATSDGIKSLSHVTLISSPSSSRPSRGLFANLFNNNNNRSSMSGLHNTNALNNPNSLPVIGTSSPIKPSGFNGPG